MTWFADLTPYTYVRSDERALNVGWLDATHPFATGEAPSTLVTRLDVLATYDQTNAMMGPHTCELCTRDGKEPFRNGAEIRVIAASGRRYAAPTMITHYIAAHGYLPPQPFIEAVLRMQLVDWKAALLRIQCSSCWEAVYVVTEHRGQLDLTCPGCNNSHSYLVGEGFGAVP